MPWPSAFPGPDPSRGVSSYTEVPHPLEPLASLTADQVVAAVAPSVQYHLTPATPPSPGGLTVPRTDMR
jgi:hypothetical protein